MVGAVIATSDMRATRHTSSRQKYGRKKLVLHVACCMIVVNVDDPLPYVLQCHGDIWTPENASPCMYRTMILYRLILVTCGVMSYGQARSKQLTGQDTSEHCCPVQVASGYHNFLLLKACAYS